MINLFLTCSLLPLALGVAILVLGVAVIEGAASLGVVVVEGAASLLLGVEGAASLLLGVEGANLLVRGLYHLQPIYSCIGNLQLFSSSSNFQRHFRKIQKKKFN